MSDTDKTDEQASPETKRLGLKRPGRLELKKTVDVGQVRQSFSHGRSRAVTVEVKKKRTFERGETGRMQEVKGRRKEAPKEGAAKAPKAAEPEAPAEAVTPQRPAGIVLKTLTEDERELRARALDDARKVAAEARRQAEIEARERASEVARLAAERAEADRRAAEEETRKKKEEEARRRAEEAAARRLPQAAEGGAEAPRGRREQELAEEAPAKAKRGRVERRPVGARRLEPRRRSGKLTVVRALDEGERVRSLAAVRRQREREKQKLREADEQSQLKVVREVVIPEAITVGELANRMAVRGADVVKALMNMGQMATINQSIDADTAEILVSEFGHRVKRVSAADVEEGLGGAPDEEALLKSRPPVVTVMGHVDHGKTTLLDALRETDVAGGEAGGITQHIGAYQVHLPSGATITFLDTPGHEAFTAMRARGASVTDIVVLVVAADDGIMPQTVEAINHAKAARVPIVVAVNKIDKPDANEKRVRQELLNYEIVTEEMGGETLAIPVSAKKKTNLDKLEEAILLQSEILDLKANPDRPAEGVVIEAKMDQGLGPVATVLVRRGTLAIGDIVVIGNEWGRVRALKDDRSGDVRQAGPSMPVQILGLSGVPEAGDAMNVVDSERRAREITSFRASRQREARVVGAPGTVEQMFQRMAVGEARELPVVVKADVHGSVEAIVNSLGKIGTDEARIRVLHAAVGGITESDVTLAKASDAVIIGFNVRANKQARDLAHQAGVDIKFYSIIYELVDAAKAMVSGLLAPERREKVLGQAEILEVFTVSKVGKIAGCRVTEGLVRRGARARLLRDDVVIHDGELGTLKRFKEDVREVKEGYECGMSLAGYQDIQPGDRLEFYEIEEIARAI